MHVNACELFRISKPTAHESGSALLQDSNYIPQFINRHATLKNLDQCMDEYTAYQVYSLDLSQQHQPTSGVDTGRNFRRRLMFRAGYHCRVYFVPSYPVQLDNTVLRTHAFNHACACLDLGLCMGSPASQKHQV